MGLVSNLLAEVCGLLCADEGISLPRGLEERLEAFPLKALVVQRSIWRAEGGEVLGKGGVGWRRGEEIGTEGIVVGLGEGEVAERGVGLWEEFLGRGRGDADCGDADTGHGEGERRVASHARKKATKEQHR